MPIDPNATTPPPEYYYYEEDIDNPDYVAGGDSGDYDVDYASTTPESWGSWQGSEDQTEIAPINKNENKLRKNLKKFLHNLAKRSKKNGQRLMNRIGRL